MMAEAESELVRAVRDVPNGAHAVGVSGGADSMALLTLLREYRREVRVHVVHLNHELRGEAAEGDAAFVAEVCRGMGVPCTVARRREVEPAIGERPANPSALYRAMRLRLFADVVAREGLDGVLLAHHADDQAETVMHRLLRGSGPAGLGGMRGVNRVEVGGVSLLMRRPLLGVPGQALREYLRSRGVAWREDASNASDDYARNRVRKFLQGQSEVSETLVEFGARSRELQDWVRGVAPQFGEEIVCRELAELPRLVAHEAVRRWLREAGSPADDLTPEVLDRFVGMARDAASPGRQHFPGKVLVARRRGRMTRVG